MKKSNLTLELPNFEGPLDLLLHLIQSQKIDIYDIPIAQITSQYLDYLRQMQSLNLQIAGEYFVMSSTLLRIKSQYLLPQNDFVDQVEPDEDPRDELVQQLVQYSLFKKVSAYFKERNEKVPITVAKEASVSKDIRIQPLPKGQITSADLATTFSMVLRRLKMRRPDTALIKVAETPINEMIDYLQVKLTKEKRVSFFYCADQMKNISDVIGLFLAMLELSKNHQVKITQSREFGDLDLERMDANGK
ncbi:segregation and condensation protein A [Lactobacillus kefiranofaciens]|uniref:Segregation and condensation protein A n=1 Tax=Lactobacillus kefiranofaciens TaxID=267818 RepID=A0AAX3UFB8_9LACO|nr:segregation/condensation protein A [Lactobacillus kefiranofaciens]AEG40402.1 Segregation and condensation protein A [Lactobacillus kefiranofaciens subsp. kefiranofaciens]KRL24481.1 segregation and condensation protein A [Lactobacillus kefiranofaciens subsp. kefirgranum DSM 10550 = JCM 8572]KRM22135.1 segregation and condensation protein A [Lactobacillus kefiranofaciens subsp. kefiranofaciens DSM 5016 = JCM 6985]MCJ2172113.1 segregation/condensation protein A [Lactobacillus kefiranofaciens]M